MPNFILFDDPLLRQQLLPFTYTRPIPAIRCGIHTISEKWSNWLHTAVSYQTEDYLQQQFPLIVTEDNIFINGALCPDASLVDAISSLRRETVLYDKKDNLLAIRTASASWYPESKPLSGSKQIYTAPFTLIENVWDIFTKNGSQIQTDFEKILASRKSEVIADPYTRCYNPSQIFIEPGVNIKAAILNAENGPIYIGKNATIQEGAVIQGPFAIGESSVIAQNAKIRMNTSIGPFCKIGGEVSGSVVFGYSNKGHDGYLGNAVLGEWCNLGANTNNSNLKNDHTNVRLHSYVTGQAEDTGLTFCGLFMGDYSKAGISTMFNTGTVVGVNVNVYGGGFQPKHIPSFSWGGASDGFKEYRIEKALAVAADTVNRRGLNFSEDQADILNKVFQETREQRIIHPLP